MPPELVPAGTTSPGLRRKIAISCVRLTVMPHLMSPFAVGWAHTQRALRRRRVATGFQIQP
jgi:hypothetical protein